MSQNVRDDALVLLLDHDNFPFEAIDLKAVLQRWVGALLPQLQNPRVLTVDARAYGGWWMGETASDGRYRAAEFYQAFFPSVMQFDDTFLRLRFTFADYLISDPSGVRITNTVVSRASPQYVRRCDSAAPCMEPGCQLAAVKNWVRKRRACTKTGCPNPFESYFERREQKQVDIHLATDLMAIASGRHRARHVGVLSDDADLLPAILDAALGMSPPRTLTLLRAASCTTYVDGALTGRGVRIVTCLARKSYGRMGRGST
jgi:hypothetical protein